VSEKILRSAAIRAAWKKIVLVSDKKLNENLEFAAGDMAEAYRIGVEEAQREIALRIAAIPPVAEKRKRAAAHETQETP
jgi:hypothetical protein